MRGRNHGASEVRLGDSNGDSTDVHASGAAFFRGASASRQAVGVWAGRWERCCDGVRGEHLYAP